MCGLHRSLRQRRVTWRHSRSERRQREAIETFAARSGHDVLDWFADPGVSGVDPIEARPGFCALLDRIEGNGVRIVLVEDASRFARDLVTQELGIVALVARGVRVLVSAFGQTGHRAGVRPWGRTG
jgi:DNA invertase Pin-like site-specific DNA recombinase